MPEQDTNYYTLLNVRRDATQVEIKKAYYRLVKELHPDASQKTRDAKTQALFVRITEAYQVLRDPNRRRIYDRELRAGKTLEGKKQKPASKRAEIFFRNAILKYKNGELKDAMTLLEAALRLDEKNPKYMSYYGLCLSNRPSTLHKAREYCEKAIEHEFYQPSYYTNLGIVYFNARLYSRAKRQFREALKWDEDNKRAHEYMRRISKKEKGKSTNLFKSLKKLFKSR